LLACFSGIATAAELRVLEVRKQGGRIYVDAEITIDAPEHRVFDALIDYNSFGRWSRRFSNSSYIEPDADGRPRVQNDVKGCVLFFCKTIKRVLTLTMEKPGYIKAVSDPELSDVNYGVEEWFIEETEEGTQVVYSYEVEFDFWVPPVVGVWALKRALKKDALTSAKRIEEMAN